ncbi:MAG: DNA sulfur modification protein DndB [Bacteroidaceae bacterium]|nr:DNA sulfur modification protein DndB [Bacteroidaceae bacterium]
MTKKRSEYIELSAVRGVQAGRQYYTAMCPLHLAVQMFSYSDSSLPPDIRAQRVLNKRRVPEMRDYILENLDTYVFSALTASIDGDIEFIQTEQNYRIGKLKISLNSRIIINDGQHRQAAIAAALEENPALRNEDISIVLYHDLGLVRSQQMFSDLNRHAVRPTRSLNILYENRDERAVLIKQCIDEIPMFYGSVEKERSSISNRSKALFTLSGIHAATEFLLKGVEFENNVIKEKIIAFWNAVSDNMITWQKAKNKSIAPCDFRKDYVCAHTIMLKALGTMGNRLIMKPIETWKKELAFLKEIDWSKDNVEFQGLVLVDRKITASRSNQAAFSEYLIAKHEEANGGSK